MNRLRTEKCNCKNHELSYVSRSVSVMQLCIIEYGTCRHVSKCILTKDYKMFGITRLRCEYVRGIDPICIVNLSSFPESLLCSVWNAGKSCLSMLIPDTINYFTGNTLRTLGLNFHHLAMSNEQIYVAELMKSRFVM